MSQFQSTAADTAPQTKVDERDQIAKQARAEYEAGLKYRHDREVAWHVIEDFYFNKVKKTLKSRFNVPIPILPGFVEAWMAKMAKHPTLKFEHDSNEAEYPATLKVAAFYSKIKNKDDYDWDMADTDGKKLACLSGRSIYEKYAESVDGFKDNLHIVDHYDFIADPIGGGNLEEHRFCGVDNVFRSREDLKAGVGKLYDSQQVEKLINTTKEDTLVNNDNVYRSKLNRFIALGLDGISYNYAGQDLYKFIKMGTTWKGQRYYVLFNYETGVWVRCLPLKDVSKSNLWPWTSWATHRDTFNFWSKSPCDDMVPLTEMIRVLVNQELDNRNKKNYGQRMYDPDIITDPSQLEWRADGLVAAKSGLGAKRIADGIFEFQTPELEGTINLVTWIDSMLKEKSGINSEVQGSADTSKVGIAYLNVQQSAERTVLTYESYVKCWQAIGRRFLWGLFEHMRKPMAVKIIGESGAEWDELARREVNPEWNIRVEGGEVDMQKDEIKKKSLADMFVAMTPDELAVTSPKWRVKVKLQNIGLDDDDIRMAFDLEGDQNKEILAKASQMIQDCLQAKPYKPYRGATTAFVQKIVDYATDEDLDIAEFTKLMKIAQEHMAIAAQNAARKAVQVNAAKGVGPNAMATPQPSATSQYAASGNQPPADQPAANTPGGTQSQSQNLTQLSPQPNAVQ